MVYFIKSESIMWVNAEIKRYMSKQELLMTFINNKKKRKSNKKKKKVKSVIRVLQVLKLIK